MATRNGRIHRNAYEEASREGSASPQEKEAQVVWWRETNRQWLVRAGWALMIGWPWLTWLKGGAAEQPKDKL